MAFGLMEYDVRFPSLDTRHAEPSRELYKKLLLEVTKRYRHDFYHPPENILHNHYVVVLRECPDIAHGTCYNLLYVACPKLCIDHTFQQYEMWRLKWALKGVLYDK